MSACFFFTGQLKLSALTASVQQILKRHPSLCTGFRFERDTLMQVAATTDVPVKVRSVELEHCSLTHCGFEKAYLGDVDAEIQLDDPALFSLSVYGDVNEVGYIVVRVHHIVADGTSVAILCREISDCYNYFVRGVPLGGDPAYCVIRDENDSSLSIPGEDTQYGRDYWRRHLSGAPTVLMLPTLRPRPDTQTFTGGVTQFSWGEGIFDGISAIAKAYLCTSFVPFLACWAAVLSRLTGQTDIIVGVPFSTRATLEQEDTIGLYVNALPIRVRLERGVTWSSLIRQVRNTALDAQDHSYIGLSQIVADCEPTRSLSFAPLFQVMLAWQNGPAPSLELCGTTAIPIATPQPSAKFDLTLNVTEQAGAFVGTASYAMELFSDSVVKQHVLYIHNALRALILHPEGLIVDVDILPAEERRRLLVDWNATEADYPAQACLHQLFEAQVEAGPDAVALVFGEATLSYAALNMRANQLAQRLRQLGVGPDVRVAICVERSLEMVTGMLAVLKAGGAYVPLDPTYPLDRLTFMLADSGPRVVLTHAPARDILAQALERVNVPLQVVDLDPDLHQDLPSHNLDLEDLGLTSSHLAYVIYTSGSTGTPKGVMIEHSGLLNLAVTQIEAFEISHDSVIALFSSISFDAAISEVFTALVAGACLCIIESSGAGRLTALSEAIRVRGVTHATVPPSAISGLTDISDLDGLECLILAGEPLQAHLARKWGRHRRLINAYGPTEATVCASVFHVDLDHLHSDTVPIGRPISNTRIYILDDRMEPVPTGAAGELYIGGAGVARGYLNRPDLTAERFLASPFVAGDRLYKTGDLGRYLPDGNIEFLGRNDFQVKIRGFRIELGEIEARLVERADVGQAVVLAREDAPGDKRLVAYYVAAGGHDPDVAALRAYLAERLPEYMVPAAYVRLDALPLTPNGKLDRKTLPAPDASAFSVRTYEPPLGAVEEALAAIWAEVLGLERVGRNDNFFELGGHSLLAVRISFNIIRLAGLSCSERDIFSNPTVQKLASALVGLRTPHEALSETTRTASPLLASSFQRRIWAIEQSSRAGNLYNIALRFLIRGSLNIPLLRTSICQAIECYPSLRTQFEEKDGALYCSLAPIDSDDFIHVVRQEGSQAEALRKIAEEANYKFDLEAAPLMRVLILQDCGGATYLSIVLHHIIVDGWSIGLFLAKTSASYSAGLKGAPLSSAAEQLTDYGSHSFHQIPLYLTENSGRTAWRNHLLRVQGPERLVGVGRANPLDFFGDSVEVKIGEDLTRALRLACRSNGVTVFETLLATYVVLLSRLFGKSDIVIGVPLANRSMLDADTVAPLAEVVPIMLSISEYERFADLVGACRTAIGEVAKMGPMPYDIIEEILHPGRGGQSTSLFQVAMLWQSAEWSDLNLSDALVELVRVPEDRARHDLTLTLSEGRSCISGQLNFKLNTITKSCAQMYVNYYLITLSCLIRDFKSRLIDIDILPAEERRRLLVDWNATEADYPAQACLHQLFEAQVEAGPDAVALVFGEATLSYAALNMRANQLAQRLRQLGVGPDVRVAICVERSLEMVTGMLAVLKAGGAYVPLDPTYPLDRLTFMLADSGPRVVLTHAPARDILAQALERVNVPLQVVDLDPDLHQDLPSHNLDLEDLGLTSSHLAYVIYTSGSTGTPKGVMIEHKNASNYANAVIQLTNLNRSDVISAVTTIAFDISFTELIVPLLAGASVQILAQEQVQAAASGSAQFPLDGATMIQATPSLLHNLPSWGDNKLRLVICGGETLSAETGLRCAAGSEQWLNMYGPTESTVWSTGFFGASLSSEESILSGTVPIGRPISNTRIYILDDRMEPVPTGAAGELYIGGAGVARGYLNRPDLTAERFLASPFVAGDRLYKTGDLGRYLPDGNIEFLGRNDFQVKIRGFRIELGEIEARLVERADVGQAVVLAREDAPGDKRLVAYYVAAGGHDPDVAALRAYLAERLPEYMVPAAYVRLDALPLTPNGKLDRKTLPAPDASAFSVRTYEPPLGAVEEALAAIWAEVLGLERVGRNDNFFELGGHSLLAVRVLGRMRQEGLRGNVKDLFASPTLTEWAHSVQNAHSGVVVPPNLIPEGCMRILPEMLPLVALDQDEIDRIVEAVPGGVRNVQDIYPLAPLQEGILFHHLMSEGGDPYLLWTLLSFDERRQLERYVEALNAVIARHDILRTAVAWEGLREPVQVVWRRAPLLLEDTVLDPASGEAASQLRKRFDPRAHRLALGQAPLMRLYAAQDPANGRWIVMWLFHHLSSDHTTLERIQDEVHAHLNEHVESLPPPSPFRNFVAQARLGVSQEEHEAFFREMLADVEEPTAPFGLLDVQGDGSEVREARLKIEDDLARRLHASARRLGVGVASLCHVAWAQVLSRSSGRKDVVFGTVLFGRMQGGEGTDHALGLFINTLPIRIDLRDNQAHSTVRDAHDSLADLLQHEHASLALAQRCSAVPPPAPLFSALLNYRHNTVSAGEERQTRSGFRRLEGEVRTNYPVLMLVDNLPDGIFLDAQVVPPLDPSHVCALMDQALRSLADALESAPGRPVEQLDILPAEERRRLLVDWNATEADYPAQACLHQLFEAQVEAGPDAVALVFGEATLSYAALNMRANQLAQRLRQLGVGPDVRVAICVERSLEMVTGMLAVLKAGGAYVPLDPTYPLDRLTFMLADSGPRVVLTHAPARDILAQALERVNVPLQVVDLDPDLHQDLPSHNLDLKDLGLTSSHLAYVIYTSGSTGTPKGVMIEHKSIVRLFSALKNTFNCHPLCVWACIHSFAFDFSVWEIWSPLSSAASLVLLDAPTIMEPRLLYRAINEFKITHLSSTPTAFKALVTAQQESSSEHSVKYVCFGGEALYLNNINSWLCDPRNSSTTLINLYGITEITIHATSFSVNGAEKSAISIGRPISNTRIYILDDRMEPVPTGAAGELYIGGAGVARGYLNRPDLTAERFLASPFVAGDRLYKTGDLGRYLPDGNIEFLGRNDFQVKIRGFRIELGEIEARLVERADVGQAVVLAREDAPGDKRLVAYYVAAGGHDPDVAALRAYLAERLPEYMVPAAYVRLDALPLTPNGKLDRKTLPAPDASAFSVRTYEPPLGAVEEALAAIWAEVLGLERVGRNDNFFELGGHSLLAVRVLAKAQRENIAISMHSLFSDPTIIGCSRQSYYTGSVVL